MKQFIFSALALFFSALSIAQYEQFDSIFSQWNDKNIPGVAAGLIHKGDISYLKGFGVADVESEVKITPQTKFMVGDLSKQFTVLALLVLEDQGKLTLEDDIRKYIPELPEYKTPIKVKHLLNHSSGLNNLDPVKLLLGIRQNDVFIQEDVLKIIYAQQKLNFTPGTDFSYFQSDTEVILMAEIIAKASGQSFIEFTSKHVFEPLNMKNTQFNNNRSLLENTATSYQIGKQLTHNPVNDLTLGVTNLYTTAEDLAKWYINFTKSTSKIGHLIKKLDTYVTSDSGKTYTSFWGKMTYGRYFDHPERGLKMSWHYGLVGGYACNVFRYHKENLISFVLGNNNRYNGMPAGQMASMILENDFTEPPVIDYGKIKSKKLSKKQLTKYEGSYYDQKNHLTRQITYENDSLRYVRLESNRTSALIPLSKNTFQMLLPGDNKVIVNFDDESKKSFTVSMNDSDGLLHSSFTPFYPVVLEDYIGSYHNSELGITYTFTTEDTKLVAENFKTGKTEFFPIIKDKFRSNTYILSGIKFSRDRQNKIDGFSVHTDGINGLFFKKI